MTWTIIIPIIGIIALLVAAGLAANVKKQSEGTDRNERKLQQQSMEGARAFLFAEYKILAIIIVIVFVAVSCNWLDNSFMFLNRSVFSIIAGFLWYDSCYKSKRQNCGMLQNGSFLSVAFRGGASYGTV